MADMTTATAMAHAPTSDEKTALLVDIDALYAEIATSQAAGAWSALVNEQLQSELVDFAERIADEMTDHTD